MAVLTFLKFLPPCLLHGLSPKNFWLPTCEISFPGSEEKKPFPSFRSALAPRFPWVLPCGSVGCWGQHLLEPRTLVPCVECSVVARVPDPQGPSGPTGLATVGCDFLLLPWQEQSLVSSWEMLTGAPCCSSRRINPLPPQSHGRTPASPSPPDTLFSQPLCDVVPSLRGAIGSRRDKAGGTHSFIPLPSLESCLL